MRRRGPRARQVLIASGCSAARWPGGRLPSPANWMRGPHGRLVYLLNYDPRLRTAHIGRSVAARCCAPYPRAASTRRATASCTGIAHEHIWARLARSRIVLNVSPPTAPLGRRPRGRAWRPSTRSRPPGRPERARPPSWSPPDADRLAPMRRSRQGQWGPVYWAAELEQATRVGARPGGFVVDNPRCPEGSGRSRAGCSARGGAPCAPPGRAGRPDRDSIARAVAAASRAGVQTSWVARGAEAVGEVVAGMARAAEEVGSALVRASAHRIEAWSRSTSRTCRA